MPSPPPDPSASTSTITPTSAAWYALAVLFGMNLLNYVDRYVFFAVGLPISKEMGFDDRQFGILSSSFMVVYTLASPLVGYLGDRTSRRMLLAVGVGLWSLATVGTAFAGQVTGRNFAEMFFWRGILGIGEASYGVVAPGLLADLFPMKWRGRVMGLFYLALPVGGAIGYGLGGWIGAHYDWRFAFLVVGLPGILAALAGLFIKDPGRGASEGVRKDQANLRPRPTLRDYLPLFRNPTFLYNSAGLAAVTFATGAYAAWGVIYYQRVRGMGEKEATSWIGGMTLIGGLLGILLGIWLPDVLLKFSRRAYLAWAGFAVVASIPFLVGAILITDRTLALASLFVAMVLMASVLGPCNTVTANVVPAGQRAAGFAMSIFFLHLFGDISSPVLIGYLSDWFGNPAVAESPLGQAFAALGAVPVPSPAGPSNLTIGILVVVPMLLLGGIFFLLGSRHLLRDQEKAHQRSLDELDDEFAAIH